MAALALLSGAMGGRIIGGRSGVDPRGPEQSTTSTAPVTLRSVGRPDEVDVTQAGPDPARFEIDALAEPILQESCTLSGGERSTCYRITVAGAPTDHAVGPFCPATTSSGPDEAGIWFDGNGRYDLDGAFVTGLAGLYGDDRWLLHDEDGRVRVTDTPEAFAAAARPDVAPEFQNHCVEGRIDWLPDGSPIPFTIIIPTRPVHSDTGHQVGRYVGITTNGVMIAGPAPVHAILGAYTIAAYDDCGGHLNPFEGYHLHGVTECSGEQDDGHADLVGYALDGYPIHKASDNADDLDLCGGHSSSTSGYHYHAAPVETNAVIGCFAGQYATTE